MAIPSQPKRLVLCFDGTAKKFAGDQSDSNVVKIYQMLDREAEDQFHYYQPGIGTYIQNDSSYGWLHDLRSSFSMILDQAFGLSFRSHVVAGYQFIMRYYSPGDYIYIVGFSRGAYTARFLAEMLYKVGLLSRGNEEMVSFAWKTFSDFQTSRKATARQSAKNKKDEAHMADFKKTFCREKVDVHFLGLFDCVNSVGQFDLPFTSSSYPHIPTAPAKHIRHAVSINERRIKFKPALFMQQKYIHDNNCEDEQEHSLKEVWFAGAHGDVGGGWPCVDGETRTLSTISLKWMIKEMIELPDTHNKLLFGKEKEEAPEEDVEQLAMSNEGPEDNLNRYVLVKDKETPNFPRPHDELVLGRAKGFKATMTALAWHFIEWVPLFTRLVFDLRKSEWVPRTIPPNRAELRQVPKEADIHPSVELLHRANKLEDWEVESVKHFFKRSQSAQVTPSSADSGLRAMNRGIVGR